MRTARAPRRASRAGDQEAARETKRVSPRARHGVPEPEREPRQWPHWEAARARFVKLRAAILRPLDGSPLVRPSEVGVDRVLVGAVLALCAFGIVMVFSSGAVFAAKKYGDSTYFLKRELIYAALGLTAMSLASRVDYATYRKYAYPLLGVSILTLAAVLKIGSRAGGAIRWFRLGPLSFQPGELAKFALCVYLAALLARQAEKVKVFSVGFLPPLVVTGLMMGLLLKQPDLGTAVIFGVVALGLLCVAGTRASYLVVAVLVAAPAGWQFIVSTPFRMKRMLAFLDPWAFRRDVGYQITESLISVGSGGVTGLGLGDGRQKLFFLPEAHTDFILSIVGEELGLIGVLFVVATFAVLVWRGLRAAFRARDVFGCYLAFGITAMFGLQALVNIGVVLGSLPTKGLPLPFISYGGTSLVVSLFMAGVLANISARNPEPGEGLEGLLATVRGRARKARNRRHADGPRLVVEVGPARAVPPPPSSPRVNLAPVPLRVLIAGGGTGGHLYPGIALAEEITKDGGQVLFVGTSRGLESKLVPAAGFPLELMEVAGLKRKGLRGFVRGIALLPRAFFRSRDILKRFKPDLVVGVGGYASGPLCFAAAITGYPTVIQEQNSRPGLTNRILGRLARRVFVAFSEASRSFAKRKLRLFGNPVRQRFLDKVNAQDPSKALGDKLVILGGSQGSHAVNELVSTMIQVLKARYTLPHVIHQTGEAEIDRMVLYYEALGLSDKVEVRAFIDDVPAVLADAALVVARAGALTLAELAIMGRPAVLIPLPTAADDHQTLNALEFARAGAAVVVPQYTTAGNELADLVSTLLGDPARLAQMGEAMRKLGRPHATRQIVDELSALVAGKVRG